MFIEPFSIVSSRSFLFSLVTVVLLLSSNSNSEPLQWEDASEPEFSNELVSPDNIQDNENFSQFIYAFDFSLFVTTRQLPLSRSTRDIYVYNDTNRDGFFDNDDYDLLSLSNFFRPDTFYLRIAATGKTLFIAAKHEDFLGITRVGKVLQLIDHDGDNIFSEEIPSAESIVPWDIKQWGSFGSEIAAFGDKLVVVAEGSLIRSEYGGVYVITDSDSDGDFSNESMQKIMGSGTSRYNLTADRVAIYEHTIVISNYNSGGEKIYIVHDSDKDGDFGEETFQEISAPEGDNPNFGWSISIYKNKIAIGAPSLEENDITVGAVYTITDTDEDGDFLEEELLRVTGPFPAAIQIGNNVEITENSLYVSSYVNVFKIDDKNKNNNFADEEIVKLPGRYRVTSYADRIDVSKSGQIFISAPSRSVNGVESGAFFVSSPNVRVDHTLEENSTSSVTAKAIDNDGKPVTYQLEEGLDAHLFSIDEQTGELSFIEMPDYETPLDINTDSIYLAKVRASTSEKYSFATIAVDVLDINEVPELKTPLLNQQILEDSFFEYTVPLNTFIDQDIGDVLTFSASLNDDGQLPIWLSFDNATATFSGTPLQSDIGEIHLKVTATDTGSLSTHSDFILTVENVNDAPEVSEPIQDQTTYEDTVYTLTISEQTFFDEDLNDSLTFSVSGHNDAPLPKWLTFDPINQSLTGTPLQTDVGTTSVTVKVTDSGDLSSEVTFLITIVNVNDSPSVLDDVTSTDNNTSISISVLENDTDEDGDSLSITSASAVIGTVSISNNNSTISYSPDSGFEGTDTVTYEVTDGNGGTASGNVSITVTSRSSIVATQDSSGGGSLSILLILLLNGFVCFRYKVLFGNT